MYQYNNLHFQFKTWDEYIDFPRTFAINFTASELETIKSKGYFPYYATITFKDTVINGFSKTLIQKGLDFFEKLNLMESSDDFNFNYIFRHKDEIEKIDLQICNFRYNDIPHRDIFTKEEFDEIIEKLNKLGYKMSHSINDIKEIDICFDEKENEYASISLALAKFIVENKIKNYDVDGLNWLFDNKTYEQICKYGKFIKQGGKK